jgi:hypothetical protein
MSRSQNSASTAMPADATAVHAATRRVPASERRRCLRPAISSGTGMTVHTGSMHSPRTARASSSTRRTAVGSEAGHGAVISELANAIAQTLAPSRDHAAARLTQSFPAGTRLRRRRIAASGESIRRLWRFRSRPASLCRAARAGVEPDVVLDDRGYLALCGGEPGSGYSPGGKSVEAARAACASKPATRSLRTATVVCRGTGRCALRRSGPGRRAIARPVTAGRARRAIATSSCAAGGRRAGARRGRAAGCRAGRAARRPSCP